MPDGLVGVNTSLPNKLAFLALEKGLTANFPRPVKIGREKRSGASRLDLMLTLSGGEEVFIEVKSSTLVRDGTALFPDAVSERGARHLRELTALARAGRRSALLVLCQRSGAEYFSPADFIDPAWGQALREAAAAGVEIMAHTVDLSLAAASFGRAVEVRL